MLLFVCFLGAWFVIVCLFSRSMVVLLFVCFLGAWFVIVCLFSRSMVCYCLFVF